MGVEGVGAASARCLERVTRQRRSGPPNGPIYFYCSKRARWCLPLPREYLQQGQYEAALYSSRSSSRPTSTSSPPTCSPAAPRPSCCLQGLAFGFVLLRVESLAEEGKVRLPAQRHSRCRSCCQRAVQLTVAASCGNRQPAHASFPRPPAAAACRSKWTPCQPDSLRINSFQKTTIRLSREDLIWRRRVCNIKFSAAAVWVGAKAS